MLCCIELELELEIIMHRHAYLCYFDRSVCWLLAETMDLDTVYMYLL